MSARHVIAVDLGAGSGRVIDVAFDGETITLNELHRFTSPPVKLPDAHYWDALHIWREVLAGLAKRPADTAAIGVDTWGVDFALLDRSGALLGNPVYYRDLGRADAYDWAMANYDRRIIFDGTGIQFIPINSLYQLIAWERAESMVLNAADTLLTMPDLFHYWLTGEKASEFTNATTSQMVNPATGDWNRELVSSMNIPTHFLPLIIRAGDRLGTWNNIPVIVPPTHDTASAVVAVPTTTSDYAYLSSGTWSLLGLEVADAVLDDKAYAANVTNEGGYDHTYRLLKNIMGLWIIEEALRTWREDGTDYSYEQVMALVDGNDDPFRSLIDPDDPRFLPPGDMAARARAYCQETGQPVPGTDAQVLTAFHVGLALKYRHVLDMLQDVAGKEIRQLHIIGGGSQNRVLNQMTANAIGRPVYAGPTEATALGNGVVQLISLGELGGLADARAMLSAALDVVAYEPQDTATWAAQAERYRNLITTKGNA